jgi:hypothetical protein
MTQSAAPAYAMLKGLMAPPGTASAATKVNHKDKLPPRMALTAGVRYLPYAGGVFPGAALAAMRLIMATSL